MRIVRTEQFKADFKKLPDQINRRAEKAFRFFVENARHPSLRTKKMEGQFDHEGRNIWEARVTKNYRFTFAIEGDTYILYRIGSHDIERRPG